MKTRKNSQQKSEQNPRGAGRPVNEKAKRKFLRVYPECGTVELAAKEAGVTRRTVYQWIQADPDFAARVDTIKPVAKSVYVSALEAEAHRRAVDGVEEPVFYQGHLVSHVRKYSDTLLIVLLKANAPEKYRERTEVTGENGGPLMVNAPIIQVFDQQTKDNFLRLTNGEFGKPVETDKNLRPELPGLTQPQTPGNQ